MNERFTQLAVQAGLIVAEYNGFDRTTLTPAQQKFAELIVKECVKFCEHKSNDDEHDEYDVGMWAKAESIKTSIKEHFGVEE